MTASFPRLLLPRLLLIGALSAGLVLGLSACGKRGSPKPPEGQESEYTYPHAYPAPSTVVPQGTAEDEPSEPGPLWILDGDSRTKTTTY